jgi:hypothetical protein
VAIAYRNVFLPDYSIEGEFSDVARSYAGKGVVRHAG